MEESGVEDWKGALAECLDVDSFNALALSLARDRKKAGDLVPARLVAIEAKKRGYTYTGDAETGCYVDLTPEEYAAVMTKLTKLELREQFKRMSKKLENTRVKGVKAAWEEWVYGATTADGVGGLLLIDLRRRKDNLMIYEFDMVPKALFSRLFYSDAKEALKQIYTIFAGQAEPEIRNWKEAS
jgi:hypothetical protein